MGQGKRLSARALLGAFGPMGLSAVLFDLQGKIDADQLQAAQVSVALQATKQLELCQIVKSPFVMDICRSAL